MSELLSAGRLPRLDGDHMTAPLEAGDDFGWDLATTQRLLAAAVKSYVAHMLSGDGGVEEHSAGPTPSPFPDPNPVTATEVLVMASEMLRSVNLNVFELGLWENIGRYR